ncbi:hypothetical protein JW962_00755, partial [Candidatus Dojkabacteria bacterium]|nr:hypothetical protein [Candidatus Dojkabacteria bacterium]
MFYIWYTQVRKIEQLQNTVNSLSEFDPLAFKLSRTQISELETEIKADILQESKEMISEETQTFWESGDGALAIKGIGSDIFQITEAGKIYVKDIETTGLTIPNGAVPGYVLTTNALGNAYWASATTSGVSGSISETDPIFGASVSAGITESNLSNWNTAYSWGDHSLAGYLTSYAESDPLFTAHVSSGITGTDITNWNTAYGWGDHS